MHAITIQVGLLKKYSPDWDFVIVFSDKAYGLAVNATGLTDNSRC